MNRTLTPTNRSPAAALRAVAARWLPLLAAVAAVGCFYDGDDRCGPNQRTDDLGYCTCVAGAVLDPTKRACAFPPGAAGVACSSAAPCSDAVFSHCQAGRAGDSYCTKPACTGDADCPSGYTCDTSAAPAFCRRPSKGLNKSCMASAECAGGDATWCETTTLKTCVVEDCKLTAPGSCDVGMKCCDVGTSRVGFEKTLCLPVPVCP